jgi:hypothetical protein
MMTEAGSASQLAELERILAATAEEMIVHESSHREGTMSGATEDEFVVATISFSAEHARGCLTIIGLRKVIAHFQPVGLELAPDLAVCDVMAELANMLLGRLKNQLLVRGVGVRLSLPKTGIARNMRPSEDAFSDCQEVSFEDGRIFMRLSASFDDDFSFPAQIRTSQAPLAEGHLLYFED